MKKILVVAALIAAATAQAGAQDHGHSPSDGPRQSRGVIADPRPLGFGPGQDSSGRVIYANAPGGAYIDCDPRNPSSPVRCKPDGW